jgi:hypothetical protein
MGQSHWAEREESERAGRGTDRWGPPTSGRRRAGASWAGFGRKAEEGGM